MKLRLTLLTISLLATLQSAASMARVTAVADDARTLVIDRAGKPEPIRLAGIAITDAEAAKRLLEWTVVASWVLLEKQPDGAWFVYRSPDALFVNRELVLRGHARATLPAVQPASHVIVTYLGTVEAGPVRSPVRVAPARGSGSDTSRRSRATRSRKSRRK